MSSIKLASDKTTLEIKIEAIESPLKRIEQRISSCIHDLNLSFDLFWKGSDAEIEELLNHIGVAKLQQLFDAHATNAAAYNSVLESRGISSPRAKFTRPRDMTINEFGVIRLVPIEITEEQKGE